MRAVARGGGLIAFHLFAAWVGRQWSPAPPAPQTAAPPEPAPPRAAPAFAPPARSCPAAAPPVAALVPDLCAELARCLPAPPLPSWEHCPDPCPACPKPEAGGFKWGVELGFGFLTLLLWEAFTCGAALRSQVRRLCSGARAPAAPAALEDDRPAGKADRRFPGGKGRLVAA